MRTFLFLLFIIVAAGAQAQWPVTAKNIAGDWKVTLLDIGGIIINDETTNEMTKDSTKVDYRNASDSVKQARMMVMMSKLIIGTVFTFTPDGKFYEKKKGTGVPVEGTYELNEKEQILRFGTDPKQLKGGKAEFRGKALYIEIPSPTQAKSWLICNPME